MRIKINVDLEAKNCPFCGKPPVCDFDTSRVFTLRVRIECPDGCVSKGEEIKHNSYGYYEDVESACERLIKKWNARAEE